MSDRLKDALNKLVAARAYCDEALNDVAIALQEQLPGQDVEPEEEPCDHPRDSRIQLAGFGQPAKWKCRDCGYRYDESDTETEVSNGRS